jgi:hypothetical protein
MEIFMHSFITLIMVVLLSGCAALQPKPPMEASALQSPEKDKALLYTMRLSQILGVGSPAHVIIDGKEITTLWNGDYITTPLSPGKHIIMIKWIYLKNQVIIDAKPGNTYFVLTGWYSSLPGCAICSETKTEEISQDEALRQLSNMDEKKPDTQNN